MRTEQGRAIRKAFVADVGHVLLAADDSQIELRVLARMCGDQGLIDAFQRGVDIHKATAAKIFNVSEALVNPEQRRASKTINFGVLYGMSAFRLSNELGISRAEAKDFIDAYFWRYPKIRQFLDATLEEARSTGRVRTMSGRIRYIPEIHNKSFTVRSNAERMATNAPIQGTAADLPDLEVKVLRGPGHWNPREPQGDGREAGAEGSGERTCGPTNRNRIRGDASQGEWATNHEAVVTKERRRRSGGRAEKASALIRGGLASRLKGRRSLSGWPRAERGVSRGHSSGGDAVKGRTMDERLERGTRTGHAPEDHRTDGARTGEPG